MPLGTCALSGTEIPAKAATGSGTKMATAGFLITTATHVEAKPTMPRSHPTMANHPAVNATGGRVTSPEAAASRARRPALATLSRPVDAMAINPMANRPSTMSALARIGCRTRRTTSPSATPRRPEIPAQTLASAPRKTPPTMTAAAMVGMATASARRVDREVVVDRSLDDRVVGGAVEVRLEVPRLLGEVLGCRRLHAGDLVDGHCYRPAPAKPA